ncbi:MAG: Ig domain-containing protein [Lentihominibacter sp.]
MKLRNRKFIVSVLTALMMVVAMMPGMAFADDAVSAVSFEITGADSGSTVINLNETKTFGIDITEPQPYEGDYHIHYNVSGGKQFIEVKVADDGKNFYVTGKKESSGASVIGISLYEGANCAGGTCSGVNIGAESKSLNVQVVDSNAPDNPWQGDSQQLKLKNYFIKVIDDTADPIINSVIASKDADNTMEFNGKQDISFRFLISNQGNYLGTLDFTPYIHIIPEGSDEEIGTISWNKVEETTDNDFDVIISAGTLEPGHYTLKFDGEFCIRSGGKTLGRAVEFQFNVAPVKVTEITLDKDSETLEIGDEITLIPAVGPEDATDKTVTWTSTDENVAIVDSEGTVTAVGAGTAIITVTANDGSEVSASCEITVNEETVLDPENENDDGDTDKSSGDTDTDKTDTVKTGDDMNIFILLAVMIISMATAAYVILHRRQRQ